MLKRSFLILFCALATVTMAEDEKTPLGKEMDAFDTIFKALKKEQDPSKGAELARKAQHHLIQSLAFTPALTNEIPKGPAQDKALAQYRRMISQALVTMCQTEEAYLAGNIKQVEQLRKLMLKLKEVGHEEYVDE